MVVKFLKVYNDFWNTTTFEEGNFLKEDYLLHQYSEQFYGEEVKGVALGYLRPMLSFRNLSSFLDKPYILTLFLSSRS